MKLRIALLAVVLAMAAAPLFAQRESLRDYEATPDVEPWGGEASYATGQYLDNPCTAIQDWVWVEYSADAFGNQTEVGVSRYQFAESTSMAGSYTASGSSSTDIGYDSPVSSRHYHKVNTPDDFHVVTVIDFDPAHQCHDPVAGNGLRQRYARLRAVSLPGSNETRVM